MNKKLTTIGIALLALTAGTARAAEGKEMKTTEGTVASVDVAAKTFTLRTGDQLEAFSLGEGSSVIAEGREGTVLSLAQLKPGDYVSVEYDAAIEAGHGTKTAAAQQMHTATPAASGSDHGMMHKRAHRIERKKLETVSGTVVAVDPKARSLSLKTDAGVKTFKVALDSASYQEGRQSESLALRELHPNDHVTVDYRTSGHEMHIQRLVRRAA